MDKKIGNVNLVRWLSLGGMLAALSTVLMYISFGVPVMPSFIKMDLSDLPALFASYVLGPLGGVAVCLIKNIMNIVLKGTDTAAIGELSNFMLGCCLVVPAGFIFKKFRGMRAVLLGGLAGAVVMAAMSVVTNYFLVYPMYSKLMPMDVILNMYKAINPKVNSLLDALLWFNMPFTFVKGILCVAVCTLVYKPIARLIK
jgi:riboflavin transporter FmnP